VATAKPKEAARQPNAAAVPDALTTAEPHPYLAKIRPGVAKRFALTRMEPLFEAVDFAWYLVALGREHEARSLVDDISAHSTRAEWGALLHAVLASEDQRTRPLDAGMVKAVSLAVE
jgi:hypothetical protein